MILLIIACVCVCVLFFYSLSLKVTLSVPSIGLPLGHFTLGAWRMIRDLVAIVGISSNNII